MNRVVLVLNVVVLLVNFFVSFTFSNAQIGILDTTIRASGNGRAVGPMAGGRDISTAYLRVVQSMDSVAPASAGRRTPEQYRALYDAVSRYYDVVRSGVAQSLGESRDPKAIGEGYSEISRAARFEVEKALVGSFRDSATVTRVATEIIRNCS